MNLVRIQAGWTPVVRYAARTYKRDVRRAQRAFERRIQEGMTEGEALSSQCAEEAQAVIRMLRRLGYGAGRLRGRARDRLELELQVHERDPDVSLNFFRVYLAQQNGMDLHEVFSRKGRERFKGKAEELRERHVKELRSTLAAREAVRAWLARYFGRFELGRKYREFCRIQFDESLDEGAKLSYMSLLITQIANRSGRERGEVLAEWTALARAIASARAPDTPVPADVAEPEGPTGEEGGAAPDDEG